MRIGSASSSGKQDKSRWSHRSCFCACLEARWPRLWKRASIKDKASSPNAVRSNADLGSDASLSRLQKRLVMKRALVKACILELAQDTSRRGATSLARKARQEAVLNGRAMAAFPSPRPRQPGGNSSGVRQLVPAMVLPRWESFDGFKSTGIDAEKLSTVKVYGGENGTQPHRLACMVCRKPVGGGEAILALVCAHIFCPVCFEVFLRRRWADLASNLVDSSETEQIPCPLCSATLQRQDVHTLTEPEVLELAARAGLVHQLAAAAASAPDRRVSGLSSQQNPNSTLAAVTAAAKAVAAAVSQTTPIVPVLPSPPSPKLSSNIHSLVQMSPGSVLPSPPSPKLTSSIPGSSPGINSSRNLAHGQHAVGSFTAKSASEATVGKLALTSPVSSQDFGKLASISPVSSQDFSKLASTSPVSSQDFKEKSVPIPHSSTVQALPKPCMSPSSGYRTYNVSQVLDTQQRASSSPHRSVSMPIQPNDLRALQHQSGRNTSSSSGTVPLALGGVKKLPGAISTKPNLPAPPVTLVNPGAIRRTLTTEGNMLRPANLRKGIVDNIAGTTSGTQMSRPLHTGKPAPYVSASQIAI